MTNLITIIATQAVINAVCTSEIKTNTTEHPFNPDGQHNYIINGYYNITVKPDEKWLRTEVVRQDVLKFDWLGSDRTITQVTPLSTNIVHLRVKTEWEEVK